MDEEQKARFRAAISQGAKRSWQRGRKGSHRFPKGRGAALYARGLREGCARFYWLARAIVGHNNRTWTRAKLINDINWFTSLPNVGTGPEGLRKWFKWLLGTVLVDGPASDIIMTPRRWFRRRAVLRRAIAPPAAALEHHDDEGRALAHLQEKHPNLIHRFETEDYPPRTPLEFEMRFHDDTLGSANLAGASVIIMTRRRALVTKPPI